MEQIDPVRIAAVGDREELRIGGKTWTSHHTPGHASHHIAWQVEDVVFTGDVGGVTIKGGPVVPPCPPPDVNVEDWRNSLVRLKSLGATTIYPTHYGPVALKSHLEDLERRLVTYVEWVRAGLADVDGPEELVPDFTKMVEDELRTAGASEEVIAAYRAANPPYMSVTGIARYLQNQTKR